MPESERDRTARRRDAVRAALGPEEVEALLVVAPSNVTYLTGFRGEASALWLTPDRAVLVSDGRFAEEIATDCPDVEAHIRPVGQPLPAAIGEVGGKLGVRRAGFEAGTVTVADFEKLKAALPTVDWKPVEGRVESLRAIKDEAEIEATREAIAIAERSMDLFGRDRDSRLSGWSEKQAADHLESLLRMFGATASAFPPIVAVGPHAALPHARPRAEAKLDGTEPVLIDWGAVGPSGYRSDLTRMLVPGKVSEKFAAVYRIVLEAQSRAIAAIRPGVPAREVDAEARALIEAAGFGASFSHGLGHGLGLDIHEAPWLRSSTDDALQAGMVLTVEPGIYLPGEFGIRIEDDVLVTPDGAEVLTRLPRNLDAVRLG